MQDRRQFLKRIGAAGVGVSLAGCSTQSSTNVAPNQFLYGDFLVTVNDIQTQTAIAYDVDRNPPKVYPSDAPSGFTPVFAFLRLIVENESEQQATFTQEGLFGDGCDVVDLQSVIDADIDNVDISGDPVVGRTIPPEGSVQGWLLLRVPAENVTESVSLGREGGEDSSQETLYEISPGELDAGTIDIDGFEVEPNTVGQVNYTLRVRHRGEGACNMVGLLLSRGGGDVDESTVIEHTIQPQDGVQSVERWYQTSVTGEREIDIQPYNVSTRTEIPPLRLQDGARAVDLSDTLFTVTERRQVDRLSYIRDGTEESLEAPEGKVFAISNVQIQASDGVVPPLTPDVWSVKDGDGNDIEYTDFYSYLDISNTRLELESPIEGTIYPYPEGFDGGAGANMNAFLVFVAEATDKHIYELNRTYEGNELVVQWGWTTPA